MVSRYIIKGTVKEGKDNGKTFLVTRTDKFIDYEEGKKPYLGDTFDKLSKAKNTLKQYKDDNTQAHDSFGVELIDYELLEYNYGA